MRGAAAASAGGGVPAMRAGDAGAVGVSPGQTARREAWPSLGSQVVCAEAAGRRLSQGWRWRPEVLRFVLGRPSEESLGACGGWKEDGKEGPVFGQAPRPRSTLPHAPPRPHTRQARAHRGRLKGVPIGTAFLFTPLTHDRPLTHQRRMASAKRQREGSEVSDDGRAGCVQLAVALQALAGLLKSLL